MYLSSAKFSAISHLIVNFVLSFPVKNGSISQKTVEIWPINSQLTLS